MPPVLPPSQVEVVVVNPPRLPDLGGEAAFSTVRIDPAAQAGTPRLDEALKQAPGLSLFRRTGSEAANPTTQGISLRGIAPSGAGRALVTLEGAPVNDPFGGWVIWSALPPEGVESASIIRGAGAGPYGAGALTGVVRLEERGAQDGLSALSLSAAERGGWRAAAAGGGENVLLVASAEQSDGYYAVRGPRRGAADSRLGLKAYSFAYRVQQEIGGVEAAARLGVYQERRGAGLVGARSIASGGSATLTLAAPSGWRLQLWARTSDLKNSSVAVAADRRTTTAANDQYATPAQGYGINAALQGRLGAWNWEAGADGRLTTGVERERFRVLNGAYTRNRISGGRAGVAGVYVDAAAAQGPWLATAGARIDGWASWRSQRREWDLETGAPTLVLDSPKASGVTPTARAGVRYAMSPELWVRAAAYGGFRPPTLNELHRPFRVGNDITESNPGLKPETLQGVEAGLGGEGPAAWRLTAFANRLEDPITNVTLGVGPATFPIAGLIPAGGVLRQRQNAGEIRAWGVEGEASGALDERLQWRTAFAYTHARVDGKAAAPQLTGKRPAQAPAWTATAGATWRPDPRLRLTTDLRYESARYDDDLNSRTLGAGLQLDAQLGWSIRSGAELYVAVENLTGSKLEVAEAADGTESYAAPRTFSIGLSYRR